MNPNVNPHHHHHHQHHQIHQHQQHQHHHHHYHHNHVDQEQVYPVGISGHHGMDDGGNSSGGGLTAHPQQQQQRHSPMPPSSWLKNTNSQSTSSVGGNSNSCPSTPNVNLLPGGIPAGSYGALSSTSFNSTSSSTFYDSSSSPSTSPHCYTSSKSSTSNNRSNFTTTQQQFYSENPDTSCYFQQQQQQQSSTFDCLNKSACDNNSRNNSSSSSAEDNFYGYYSPQQQQQQQFQSQDYHSGSASGHHQHHHHHNNNSAVNHSASSVGHSLGHHHSSSNNTDSYSRFHGFNNNSQSHHHSHQMTCNNSSYFNNSNNNNMMNRNNQQPQQQQQYGNNNCQNQTQFRRNSIESFSTEPGDIPYNVKYGCNFNTMGNIPFDPHKTESSNSSSTSNNNAAAAANNLNWSSDVNHHENPGNYFYNNSRCTAADDEEFQFEEQPNFKSCSFDTGPSNPSMDVTTSLVKSSSSTGAAVKHRSLSCSMMSSPYSNYDGHFNSFLANVHHNNVPGDSSTGGEDSVASDPPTVPLDGIKLEEITEEKVKNPHDGDGVDDDDDVQSSNLLTLDLPPIKEEGEDEEDGLKDFESKEVVDMIISTTHSENQKSEECSLLDALDDEDEDEEEDSESRSSLSLLITTPVTTTATNESNLTLPIDDNDDSCHSGISSLSNKALSDICSTEVGSHHVSSDSSSSFSLNSNSGPQKIAKRSFSEADKDLVINTTALTSAFFTSPTQVPVPAGWKRELTKEQTVIVYVSPSGTKLGSWDELKNYLCSDGTCKCGLSCPLRLEQTFSFDPKVTSTTETETTTRLLCNHKRKIPKSEDSPLISSTRDDLGDDNGGSAKKKRRRSGGGGAGGGDGVGSNNNNGTKVSLPQESPPISVMGNVSVPFSQQSPDTTTQTPQTDMSPASSVSSEQSVLGGSRSTSSTPTPMGYTPTSTPKATTAKGAPSGGKKDNTFGYPWPPSSVSPVAAAAPSPTLPSVTLWPITSTAVSTAVTATVSVKKAPQHIAPKLTKKRANSPCPNVDVRNLPPEQNRPPPRTLALAPAPSQTNTTTLPNSDSVSLFPITSSTPVTTSVESVLNTGFSISPVIPSSSGMGTGLTSIQSATLSSAILNTVQLPSASPLQSATATLINNGVNIIPLPLQLQRVTSSPIVHAPQTSMHAANTLIHQSLPSSITISMVGGSSISQASSSPVVVNIEKSVTTEKSSEKSPLQLVQDVVDRFQSKNEGEKDGGTTVEEKSEGAKDEDHVKEAKNENLKEVTVVVSTTTAPTTTTTVSEPVVTIVSLPLPASSAAAVSSIVNTTQAVVQPMMSNPILNTSVVSVTPTSTLSTPTSIILPQHDIQTNSFITTTAGGNSVGGHQSIRYPVFQTIQPFFLNQTSSAGGQLIISPQATGAGDQQSIVFDQQQQQHQQQNQQSQGTEQQIQPLLQPATMMIDPSMCGNNAGGGSKKKKKRLSKKQQQQQAQMQLQQQLILQQFAQQQAAAQVQQQVAAQQQLPFTILPQSFNLGHQGFIQPMNMNFFPTPTFLTLPNLILNPADGTLFLQPSAPLQTTAQATAPSTVKLGQFPTTTTTVISSGGAQSQAIAPKKSDSVTIIPDGVTLIKTGPGSADISSDDSRQNATPDSSTNDCQLGLNLNPSITISLPPTISIMNAANNANAAVTTGKKNAKSRNVSSSSGGTKQVFKQKQILPKIDSTTPTVVENS